MASTHAIPVSFEARLPEGLAAVHMLLAGLLIDRAAVHIDVATVHFDLSARYMLPAAVFILPARVHEALARARMRRSRCASS